MKAEDYKDTATEAEVEAQVDDWLALNGFTVLKTNEHRQRLAAKCPRCGDIVHAVSHKGSGISRGIGDRLIRLPSWPTGVWLMLEIKRPKGWKWSSKEQKQNFEENGFWLVHDKEDLEGLQHAYPGH